MSSTAENYLATVTYHLDRLRKQLAERGSKADPALDAVLRSLEAVQYAVAALADEAGETETEIEVC